MHDETELLPACKKRSTIVGEHARDLQVADRKMLLVIKPGTTMRIEQAVRDNFGLPESGVIPPD